MQPTFSSSRILLPARPGFILMSLGIAFLLNLLPTANCPYLPDWVALVLVFWAVHEPRYVSMGSGFFFGLLMDVADASVIGQHALAYVFAAYIAAAIARRLLWFRGGRQTLHILPLMLLVQFIQIAARVIGGEAFPGLVQFVGPTLAALLWWPLTFILLLPQYRPVDRDENRPI